MMWGGGVDAVATLARVVVGGGGWGGSRKPSWAQQLINGDTLTRLIISKKLLGQFNHISYVPKQLLLLQSIIIPNRPHC
jgi:hypothetical protein